jgi:hypothetical protein
MVYCLLPSAAAPVRSTSQTDVTDRSSLIGTHIVEPGNWKHLEASPSPNCQCSAIKINNTTRMGLSIKIITTLFCSLSVKLFFLVLLHRRPAPVEQNSDVSNGSRPFYGCFARPLLFLVCILDHQYKPLWSCYPIKFNYTQNTMQK